jgi:PhoH-like ATPase
MAVYSIIRSDATLINGKYGSGKSYIALAAALSTIKDGKKIYIMRPTLGAKKYALGFMPGDKDQKLDEYLSGFISSFYALWGNSKATPCDKDGQITSYDFVKEEVMPRYVEALTINTLHGLLGNTFNSLF